MVYTFSKILSLVDKEGIYHLWDWQKENVFPFWCLGNSIAQKNLLSASSHFFINLKCLGENWIVIKNLTFCHYIYIFYFFYRKLYHSIKKVWVTFYLVTSNFNKSHVVALNLILRSPTIFYYNFVYLHTFRSMSAAATRGTRQSCWPASFAFSSIGSFLKWQNWKQ